MQIRYKLLLLVLLILFGKTSKADHFAAGDIWINYIGQGLDGCTGTTEYKYEIFFDQYKACDVINFATLFPGVTISYRSQTAVTQGLPGAQGGVTLSLVSIDTLDQLCDTFKKLNSCYTPITTQPIGFERVRSSAIFTLPYAQPDWTFWFWSCCTSNNLNNVPWYQPFYIECMLNNVVKYNNSTPRFTTEPLPYLCNNQPSVFLNGPGDPNNDSMRTYNIVHYTHNNPTVAPTWLAFTPPYTLADPIGSAASNPWRMDSLTGAAYFTPTNAGRYTFDFQCDEYDPKSKVLTGYIRRTCEVNVLNCTYPPPTIDTTPLSITGAYLQTDKKRILACPGSNISFTVKGTANNTTSKVYLSTENSNISGYTFNATGQGTSTATGVFSWTPGPNQLGDFSVTIVSKDSTCNSTGTLIVQKNFVVVKIRVTPGLDAGKDQPICHIDPKPKQLFVRGTEDLTSFKWTDISGGPAKFLSADNINNPLATPTSTTSYIVSSPELTGNCKSIDTVTVFTDTTNKVDIFPQQNPFVMCRPDYLQLDLLLTGSGPRNNLPCGPSNQPLPTTMDSIDIYGSSIFGSGFSYDTAGLNTSVFYTYQNRTAKHQFLIRNTELREYGIESATLRALSFETAKSTLPANFEFTNFTISLKCVDSSFKQLSSNRFETGLIPVFIATGPTYFPNGAHKFTFDTPYDIDTTKNLIIEFCYSNNPAVTSDPCSTLVGNPPILEYMPTTYVSGLELKAINNTVQTVCNVTADPNIKPKTARPVFKFFYNKAPGLPFDFKWRPGQYLSDSTSKQPLSYVSKSTRYTIQTFGNSGCLIEDTMDIVVPVHDFYVLPKDTSICFGETAPLSVKNGTYFEWFEFENGQFKSAHESASCDRCASPVLKPKKSTFYKIKVGDELFCYDTIDAYIEVKPLPVVNILTKDTVIKYGQSVQLMVNGARIYNWTPVSSLNNPNISYPIARPTESTQYVVGGIATNGCVSFDTVRVGIDYRDNLFIPTAFSPNGDGKNDLFKVTNMTFQRYAEFRVFNRWGQEVYNGNKGWDGTWRGVAQESGTYTYLIRVAYPDGEVETYKGDVTLVR
ncbi:hypothetical protein CAP35_09210 [Chitinophagaceae bacterium IBVUCB1]|nr:hypothetical protein CAP35_09210 [Chitinophagaceae bacterium IBVUCB1]